MQNLVKSFLLMILFLTRIPLKYNHQYKDEDFLRGIKLTPVIGFIIGLFISIPFLLNNHLDKPVLVLMVWASYIWITGGLHIDGLTDTVDGLFSNKDKEKIFKIMSDSRIGAFGVIGFVFVFIFNLTLSYYLSYKYFIIMPVVGRVSSLVSASNSKYAKDALGMGTLYVENAKKLDVLLGNIFILLVFLILKISPVFFIAVIVTELIVIILTEYIKKKIDGMTGDTIGFIVEVSQTIYLFLTYIIVKFI